MMTRRALQKQKMSACKNYTLTLIEADPAPVMQATICKKPVTASVMRSEPLSRSTSIGSGSLQKNLINSFRSNAKP